LVKIASRIIFKLVSLKCKPESSQALIIFITTTGHGRTVDSLVRKTFGCVTPDVRHVTYDQAFRWDKAPIATYIFTDIERLYPWERFLAGQLHRLLGRQGCRCLNDPALVMTRYPLLLSLHRAGLNPFNAYRADAYPEPERFPVFVRMDFNHKHPVSDLLHSQGELNTRLEQSQKNGMSLSNLLVIEFFGEPIAEGAWRRWGTFRIGEATQTDHCVVENNWIVKYGTLGLSTNEMFEEEQQAVITNRFADDLTPAFKIGHIDYGRADHAVVNGKTVTYEINTNPYLGAFAPHPRSALRTQTIRLGREKYAANLDRIDTREGGHVALEKSPAMMNYVATNGDRRPVLRP